MSENSKFNMTRRDFIKLGLAGAGSLVFSDFTPAQALPYSLTGQLIKDPHFFLQILLPGGADNSYIFDARPLSMTKAGMIQNYTGQEPILYQAKNGGSALVSSVAKSLFDLKEDLCVLNGVLMATNFDGHDQNTNFLLSGNAFGGESFIPHLNQYAKNDEVMPLDALQNGFVAATVANGSRTVNMNAASAHGFSSRLRTLPNVNSNIELSGFIASRMKANSQGSGRMATGSRQLLEGYEMSTDLQNKIKNLNFSASKLEPIPEFIDMLANFFKGGVARSAIWTLGAFNVFDTHAAAAAKLQPELYKKTTDDIASIIKILKSTPFDQKQSLFDVTTVMVTSEFGRTMRQRTMAAIDFTGTDHNPLNNSVLLAGKGIKAGQVIGLSDLRDENEKPSGAHKALDPNSLKTMGRAFDFKKNEVRRDSPSFYEIGDYLTIGSVVNTLYRLFDVPTKYDRLLGREGSPVAPILNGLIK